MNYLKEKLQLLGLSQQTATRRANKVLKEDEEIIRAFTWGLDTYSEYAPTKLQEITNYYEENEDFVDFICFEVELPHVVKSKEIAYMIAISILAYENYYKEHKFIYNTEELRESLIESLDSLNVPPHRAKQIANNLLHKNKYCANEVLTGLYFFGESTPVTFKQIFINQRQRKIYENLNRTLNYYEKNPNNKAYLYPEAVACIAINSFLHTGGLGDLIINASF